MWSINIKRLLKDTTIFEYREAEKYFQNNEYMDNSLWSINTEEFEDPWLAWRKLSDEIKSTNHIFRKFDTEIKWIIYSYKKIMDSIKWPIKREEWWYHYSDIVAFYSILWNKALNEELKKIFKDDREKYINVLQRFRETRNKFFDHRIGNIEWVNNSNTELDIQFRYQDYTLILSPRFDYIQFINILKAIK